MSRTRGHTYGMAADVDIFTAVHQKPDAAARGGPVRADPAERFQGAEGDKKPRA